MDNLGVTFHVRLRNTVRIGLVKGELVCPKMTFSALKIQEVRHLQGRRRISAKKEAIRGFVSVTRSKEDELVTILSNKNQEKSLENYAKRWGIETLFGALKTLINGQIFFGYDMKQLSTPFRPQDQTWCKASFETQSGGILSMVLHLESDD